MTLFSKNKGIAKFPLPRGCLAPIYLALQVMLFYTVSIPCNTRYREWWKRHVTNSNVEGNIRWLSLGNYQ